MAVGIDQMEFGLAPIGEVLDPSQSFRLVFSRVERRRCFVLPR